MVLVSVVVPVYNVQDFLEKCVKSIKAQTYQELEIILVDDGSTDCSNEMCDKFAQEDSRIRVIHKKNGGLSDARNVGAGLAAGKYLFFLDSDDYVDSRLVEKAVGAAEKFDSDIVYLIINGWNQTGMLKYVTVISRRCVLSALRRTRS